MSLELKVMVSGWAMAVIVAFTETVAPWPTFIVGLIIGIVGGLLAPVLKPPEKRRRILETIATAAFIATLAALAQPHFDLTKNFSRVLVMALAGFGSYPIGSALLKGQFWDWRKK